MNEYCFFHGVFGLGVLRPLLQIVDFLNSHSNELVILDFQHFFNFCKDDHVYLSSVIWNTFGDKLVTKHDGDLDTITLDVTSKQKQVIIIYRSRQINRHDFWPGKFWLNPLVRSTTISDLKKELSFLLQQRGLKEGFVTKCILNPEGYYVSSRFGSTMMKPARKILRNLKTWIESQKVGEFNGETQHSVNVIIADFVDLRNGAFSRWVVDLNSKLKDRYACFCDKKSSLK